MCVPVVLDLVVRSLWQVCGYCRPPEYNDSTNIVQTHHKKLN